MSEFSCEDCGEEMTERRLCVVMFAPLDDVDREGYHRISNLCLGCRTLKRVDAMKRYPPRKNYTFEALKAGKTPEQPKLSGKPLWLYGKGELGQMAQEYFRYVGVEVAGCFEWDELAPLDAQVAVCIVKAPYEPIKRKLNERGFKDVVPFYDLAISVRGDHPWENGWFAPPQTDADFAKMESVFDRWSGDVSRSHYLQFLAWRLLREEWVFNGLNITKDNLFFIPEVVRALRDHEVFLDGGSHHGEMSAQFASLVPEAEIIAVEPDTLNRGMAHGFALADKDGTAQFAEGFGLCSKLTPSGLSSKATRRIDSLGISPTFIKLHLEGGDLPALRGGAETLVRCRPIVAVRVDHNSDGLWRTPDYLMSLLDNYRFIFRNHCWCGSAAAMYAIPEERCATQ